MSIDLTSYKPLYLKTAKEYISNMKLAYSKLQSNSSDASAIQSIYIAAHSLKSQSLIMGYKETGNICSLIETKFRIIKESQGTVTSDLLTACIESTDVIEKELANIEKGEPEISSLEACQKLESIEVKK